MLDAIGELVRNITIIVLLAAFIEMLMPTNHMTRYVRLVMGLFVIVSVLSPVMSFLDRGDTFEVVAWNYPTHKEELDSILENGEQIKSYTKEQALSELQSRLEGQIKALVRLVPGVANVDASVQLDAGDGLSFGTIKEVLLWVTAGPREGGTNGEDSHGKVRPVDPVYINEQRPAGDQGSMTGQPSGDKVDRLVEEVRYTIANFYGVSPQRVQVFLGGDSKK